MLKFDENPDLNITPLVDIMLVLLAVLMVSTPMISYEEKVSIPDGSKQNVISVKKDTLKVSAKSRDKIFINDISTNFSSFADTFLNQTRNLKKDTSVIFSIDKNIAYGDAVYIITVVTKSGFNNISLATK